MNQPENTGMGVAAGERRRAAWLAGGLLFAGLLVTAIAAWNEKADVDAAAKAEFDFTCSEIQRRILSRLSAYEQVLHGGAAFFEGAGVVTRPQWRRFFERQKIETRFIGIQGLGFARLIPRRQLARHVQEIRAEGFPAYQVSPAGERELYSAIIYLEPFRDRNLRAFGYDMFSEPVRREAMERARDQDTAALSGKVVLVQETGKEVQAGTLMYVAVYQAGMPVATVAQRRAAIRGWVYSPYRMADLLRGILGGWDLENNGRLRLEVYDGERVAPETLLYDSSSGGGQQTAVAPRLNSQREVVSAGRQWTLRFTAAGSRAATAGYGKVWLEVFGGTGASLLLAWLLFNLLNTRIISRQLSNSEGEFRTLFDNVGDAVIIHDESGRIQAANLPACAGLGYTSAELCALTVDQVDSQANSTLARERIAGLAVQDSLSFETEHRRKDGSLQPVEVSARKFNWKGRPAVVSICRDITGRKQAEAALQKSEARYRSYIELTGEIGWVTNAAGDIEEDVPSIRKFTGQTYEEARGTGWAKALHPEDLQRAMRTWNDSVASKKPCEMEYRMRRYDGVYRNFLVRSFPDFQPDGSVREWIGTCIDITERIQAENELHASMEELRTLAEAMPQIVWITRPDGWNIFFNKRWMDYTGLTLEESYGHGWNTPFHPDDKQRAWDAWHKATSENGIYYIESRLRRADGVYRWWLVRGVPLLDAAGNILKWYGTCTDIHDMKMAEKERDEMQSQLKQSQRMESIGQLAGGVAHDFNNILTAIIGYSGFLMKALAADDPKREDVKEILTAAERAAGLTRQLLAFGRKQILKTEVVDLNSVVWSIEKMLRRLIGEDIKLETRYAPSPCQVQVDTGQIEQVLVNLAVNARDAMPKGGTLTLETALMDVSEDFLLKHPDFTPGRLVCLTVKDTGCGMTDKIKEHIFEPFFTTKETGKGSGLGLSTVFGIVKQSGGEIDVESAPDRGTTFQICLPCYEAAVVGKEGDKPESGNAILPGSETVLLVEDEESLRRLGERLLRASGYTVLSAADGKEALAVMERHGKAVDLLLTDVVMPGMSGRELSAELGNRKLIRRTLFMSGYTDDAITKHGVLEPGLAFIYKPFSVEALSEKLRDVLDGPADKAKP